MESLYQQLIYRHSGPESSWIGNLRWFALEEGEESWSFHSAPMDQDHSRNPFQAIRDHFTLTLCSPGPAGDYLYGVDRVTTRFSRASAELIFPMHDYGAVIRLTGPGSQCRIVFPRQTEAETVSHGLILRDQGYFLCFLSETAISREGENLSITGGGLLSIGFSNCREAAEQAARSLLENSDQAGQRSRLAWEEYLASCPIHVTGNRAADTRQLWLIWMGSFPGQRTEQGSRSCTLAAPVYGQKIRLPALAYRAFPAFFYSLTLEYFP